MKAIESFFLRARHWQLFLLLFCTQLLGPKLLTIVRTFVAPGPGLDAAGLVGRILAAFGIVCWVAWIGSIGTFFNRLNQPSKRGPARFFQFTLAYTALYMVALDVFLSNASPLISASGAHPIGTFATLNFYFTLPLVAILCAFYAFYFAAKSLVMAQSPGPVGFRDYAGPMLMIWFFPAGLWFIQPGINRLYAQLKDSHAATS
jgi:hypothetical protein